MIHIIKFTLLALLLISFAITLILILEYFARKEVTEGD